MSEILNYLSLAYIDPATGAIVLQVIVAAVLAAGVLCRRFFVAPFRFLFKSRQKPTSDAMHSGSEES